MDLDTSFSEDDVPSTPLAAPRCGHEQDWSPPRHSRLQPVTTKQAARQWLHPSAMVPMQSKHWTSTSSCTDSSVQDAQGGTDVGDVRRSAKRYSSDDGDDRLNFGELESMLGMQLAEVEAISGRRYVPSSVQMAHS